MQDEVGETMYSIHQTDIRKDLNTNPDSYF